MFGPDPLKKNLEANLALSAFDKAMRALVRVPKAEVEKLEQEHREKQAKRKRSRRKAAP